MSKCELCGEEKKNMRLHLIKGHGMEKEEAEEFLANVEKNTPEQNKEVESPKPKEKKKEFEKTLNEFLEEYEMSETELINVVKNYKYNEPLPVLQVQERDKKLGTNQAKLLKDKEYVETTDLYTSEALVRWYGFKLLATDTAGGTKPKTYKLKKTKGDS